MKPYLSVVIPCYNEEENIKKGVLDEVRNFLEKKDFESEVIVSDDGSTDNSLSLLKKYTKKNPRFRFIENKHGGKAFAVRAGIKNAKGKIVLFTDMDQSTPISEIEKLLPFFKKSFDVVIGSRGQKREGFSPFRVIASNIFRLIRRLFLLKNIEDTQCGFKAFKTSVARDLFSRLLIFKKAGKVKGWRVSAFDVELLFVAQKRGYKIAEVPVVWQDKGVSKNLGRFIKESRQMFEEVLKVKLNDWRGYYDL